MSTDIEVWEIDPQSQSGTKLEVAEQLDTEKILEAVLASNPAMLTSGVTLVGRQVRVDAGCIDLLGIDETGRLVVFELKRGELTRDAVAQVLDYCSYLEELPESELTSLIVKGSGTNGIDKIEDFEDWYSNREGESIKPVRMKLVGLGTDAAASRMVEFLATGGIDISLITYHGFSRPNSTLLARQIQYAEAPRKSSDTAEDRVAQLAKEHRVEGLWQEVKKSLHYGIKTYYTRFGITYRHRKITLPDNVGATVSHSVTISGPGKLRITFYPAAIHLCYEEFEKLKETIEFESEKPPNAPQTDQVSDQHYCYIDEDSWQNGKVHIIEFVYTIARAWGQWDYSSRRQLSIFEEVNEASGASNQPPLVAETPADQP